jgi:hypothetical protein
MRLMLLAALLLPAPALADPFSYSTDFSAGPGPEWATTGEDHTTPGSGILGPLASGTAVLTLHPSGPGSGTLVFDLLGFNTLDGINPPFTDEFHLRVNGTEIFNAFLNFGGGGTDAWDPPGTSVVTNDLHSRTITIPVTLMGGTNSIVFDYGVLQGFGDESWGLDNVSLNATVRPTGSSVPEPATWGMMILGLGAVGAATRWRSGIAART